MPSIPQSEIRLILPPPDGFKKGYLFLAFTGLGLAALGLHLGGRSFTNPETPEEHVRFVEEIPPPPPKPVVVAPPKPPPPPPPDPDQKPPPKEAPPPKAVFGMPEDAVDKGGDVSVATGNTLMKAADSVVEKAPPPLPAAPVQLDKEPAALNQVVPEYPAWAEEQGVQAQVRLMVTIDATGAVTDAQVAASGGKDFDANALKAAKATRFQPLIRGGKALPARFQITYDFSL
jgi:protein TonB